MASILAHIDRARPDAQHIKCYGHKPPDFVRKWPGMPVLCIYIRRRRHNMNSDLNYLLLKTRHGFIIGLIGGGGGTNRQISSSRTPHKIVLALPFIFSRTRLLAFSLLLAFSFNQTKKTQKKKWAVIGPQDLTPVLKYYFQKLEMGPCKLKKFPSDSNICSPPFERLKSR